MSPFDETPTYRGKGKATQLESSQANIPRGGGTVEPSGATPYATAYGSTNPFPRASYPYSAGAPSTYGAIAPPGTTGPFVNRADASSVNRPSTFGAAYAGAFSGHESYSSPGSTWSSPGLGAGTSFDFLESGQPEYAAEYAGGSGRARADSKARGSQRRPSNRDEFDGPHQFLQRPPPDYIAAQERDLPHLPTNLMVQEQDSVLSCVNDRLSQCAFDFIAKWQFPVPITENMPPVERPSDREWSEWVYLLKRLATKRRIPTRVLYNGQIKQLVTTLENSLETRHAPKQQSRPLKDDRNILQLISAGIQVAKILKDAEAMKYLDRLYETTETQIKERAARHRP